MKLEFLSVFPLLVTESYLGTVFATQYTIDVCGNLLPDNGCLQGEDAEYANRHKLSRHRQALPLHTEGIGPDEETARWVNDVGRLANAPFVVLTKHRTGDCEIEVSVPAIVRGQSSTPQLADDIVSTARSTIETVGHLHRVGFAAPVRAAVSNLCAKHRQRLVYCQRIHQRHLQHHISQFQLNQVGTGDRRYCSRGAGVTYNPFTFKEPGVA